LKKRKRKEVIRKSLSAENVSVELLEGHGAVTAGVAVYGMTCLMRLPQPLMCPSPTTYKKTLIIIYLRSVLIEH
jgi:hypothetical protein